MDPRQFDELVKQLAKGASRRRVLKGLAGGITAMFGGKVIATQSALAAPDPKVTICHFTHSETNPYEIITISSNALNQHQTNHSDNLFGDCCLDSDCSVQDGIQCAVAVCQIDDTGTSYCGLAPTPGEACDDGIDCTVDDVCGAGVDECAGTPVDSRCDDSDACTIDTCVVGVGCLYSNVNCDDGNACTTDSCDSATGCVHETVNCDDGDACTTETCNPSTGCVYVDVICDDGDICTTDDCDATAGCIHRPIDGCCHTDDDCPRGQVCLDNVCSDNPNPECAGETCATFTECSPSNSDCVCTTVTEGGGLCVPGSTPCAGLGRCPNGSGDCAAGELCVEASCCSENVCVPIVLNEQCPTGAGFAGITPSQSRECVPGTLACAD